MEFPSKLISDSVNAFSRLPGIGKKTALRLTLHLLNQPVEDVQQFAEAVQAMREQIQYCHVCHKCRITNLLSNSKQLVFEESSFYQFHVFYLR